MLEKLSIGQLYGIHWLWFDVPVKEVALAGDGPRKELALGVMVLERH